ncbi:MAG TPA: DUF2092 domain-containing protein [Chthoniobacterales bacterium]|nr:DUF2092 domain-containing protein [Chthoniobacterales bacterium]
MVESPAAAESLLRRMEAAYGRIASYSDSTHVKFRNPDGSDRSSVDLKIWFARPGRFRVDAQSTRADGSPARREVMWTNGEKARAWASDKPVVNLEKIQIAGSRMFGTYAYHVPTLLEASYGGKKRLHELGSATMAGEENVEGVDCFRIRGEFHRDPYELWVGKSDQLIRKVVATYAGNQMEEVHRNVAVDTPIAAEIFNFAPENETVPPPAKKGMTPAKKSGP